MRVTGQRYDRNRVRQYAKRWWNDYHPNFRKFDVDCTNFVSQCMRAGGFPMHGAFRRDRGWWYQGSGQANDRWRFSWSVAHSLHWYLSSSQPLMPVKLVERAEALSVGDVICYDWTGSGRWDHTVIVVGRDGEAPLVAAHTANSYNRLWSYRDSPAWTERTRYKFFHIDA